MPRRHICGLCSTAKVVGSRNVGAPEKCSRGEIAIFKWALGQLSDQHDGFLSFAGV
jgi:hypothetical protein